MIRQPLRVRGGSGLGDSLYLRPVAEHLVKAHPDRDVVPLTNYHDIFLGTGLRTEPHRKSQYEVLAHYTVQRPRVTTNQWQDICETAGVPEIDLSFQWPIKNERLVGKIQRYADGKPVVMLNGGRPPMGRTDGYSDDMLPSQSAFLRLLGQLSDCYVVKVGMGTELYSLPCDMDLNNSTTVSDTLDIAQISSALVGQCSFMVPLAECFDKTFIGVWADKGLQSRNDFIRQCTPQKILCKQSSLYVVDNWDDDAVSAVVRVAKMKFPLERS